jgi:uncharacterized protein YhbP (UPF0306 family)
MSVSATVDELRKVVLDFLDTHSVMSLATALGGKPFAASLFYASCYFKLYYISSPESAHSLNISKNPSVAVTINKEYWDWKQVRGLQINGTAHRVTGDEAEIARRLYFRKFPFAESILCVGGFSQKVLSSCFYKVEPHVIRLIDNSVEFGFKRELHL